MDKIIIACFTLADHNEATNEALPAPKQVELWELNNCWNVLNMLRDVKAKTNNILAS